jgi:tripartite-type tricarboxylate transporter receptor subunit TctC
MNKWLRVAAAAVAMLAVTDMASAQSFPSRPVRPAPIGSSPQDLAAKIRADYDKWGPIFKAAGIKAE